jgi:glutathione S-transferase
MIVLHHYPLCPQSRSIRLALAELDLPFTLVEERPWEWRSGFLAMNPAGELPLLERPDGSILCGAYAIAEFLDESAAGAGAARGRTPRLFPGSPEDRAEVRRLTDWFQRKFDREVSCELLEQKVYAALRATPAHTTDTGLIRAIRTNLRHHLNYIGFLAQQRRWLAGDEMSFADLSAAAQLSSIDYLGEVPWGENTAARDWYSRIKSRPSFRALLADRVPGTVPSAHYANLDF